MAALRVVEPRRRRLRIGAEAVFLLAARVNVGLLWPMSGHAVPIVAVSAGHRTTAVRKLASMGVDSLIRLVQCVGVAVGCWLTATADRRQVTVVLIVAAEII